MGSEWPYGSLSELVDFTPKRTIKKGATAPFVAMADIPENSREIAHISQKEFKGSGSRFANGDTLFARITPCLQNGKIAKVSELGEGEIAHGSTEFIVFGAKDPETDQEFLYYLARNPVFRAYAESRMEGSTGRQRVSWQALAEYEFLIPSKNERRSIGRILGSLDDKIELNRQMNATLEAMAQALFKSWFVDFDPVIDNALAAGNPIPEPLQARAEVRKALGAKRKPLPEAIQKQFPSSFVFNEEMGWIPEGWDTQPLDAIVDLIGGGTPKTSVDEYWGGEIPWFSVVDAPNSSDVFVLNTEKNITNKGLENSSAKLLPKGTTIISARGTVGKCAVVARPMAMNQSCYAIRGKDVLPDYYIYYTILLRVSDLQQRGHGSVFNTITRDTFRSTKLVLAVPELLRLFDKTVSPYMDRIVSNIEQIGSLSRSRDALLPKLLSGQIRIPDAEKLAA